METREAPFSFGMCECAECEDFHAEDDYESVYYTAHEMSDAWKLGYDQGCESGVRRIYQVIREWLEEVD